MKLSPSFITCTFGAGGSTQDKTLKVISDVKRRFGVPVASHVTCVGSTRGRLVEYLAEAQNSGVDYIVALRGDPPRGETKFQLSGRLVWMYHQKRLGTNASPVHLPMSKIIKNSRCS